MLTSQMSTLMQSGGLFICIGYPLLSLVYKYSPPKDKGMNRMTSFYQAIPLLVILFALKMGSDHQTMDSNLYNVLHIGRHASPMEVRQAFKAQSLFHHPDKTLQGRDSSEFYAIKAAYDVLIDENKRDIYNRFGIENLNFDPRHDEMMIFVELCTVYLVWGIIVYIFTIPKSVRSSRTWITVLGAAMIVVQVLFALSDTSIPDVLENTTLSSITEYELVVYAHSFFPIFVLLLIFLAEALFFDLDEYTLMYLEKAFTRNEEMLAMLEHMRQQMNTNNVDAKKVEERANKLEGDLQTLIGKLTTEDRETADILRVFKSAGAKSGTNYYGILFIVVFVVMQMM